VEEIYKLGEEAEKEAEDLGKELSTLKRQTTELEEVLSTIHAHRKGVDYFSSSQKEPLYSYSPSLTFQYTKWEDFKSQSTSAKLISFLLQEKEKGFQVYALKEGKVLAYNGEFPQPAKLLKSWLSKELSTPHEKIVEGVLATG
jgi:hypothetical protein